MAFIGDLKPCILCESKLDATKMEQLKVEHGGSGRKCPVFTAKWGVEGLFHVADKCLKAAGRLNMNGQAKFENFEDVLDATSSTKWPSQIRNVGNPQRNNQRFQRELDNFIHSHTGAQNPRDILFAHIDKHNGDCKKIPSKDNVEHASRIETIIDCGNRLRGANPIKNDLQKKTSIFNTFPDDWKRDYAKSSHVMANDSVSDIVDCMNMCKEDAGDQCKKRRKKRKCDDDDDTERIRGGNANRNGRGKKGRNRNKNSKTSDKDFQQLKPADRCPIHGHHPWGQCSLNPRSENCRGNTDNRSFGGRGHGGRGFGGGRGNGGRGGGRFSGRGDGNRTGGRFNDQCCDQREESDNRNWPSDHCHCDSRSGANGASGRGGSRRDHTREKMEW